MTKELLHSVYLAVAYEREHSKMTSKLLDKVQVKIADATRQASLHT